MRDDPAWSVLIYTEHEPESLAETLESLAGQEYPNDRLEVLVLDPDGDLRRREVADRYGSRYVSVDASTQPAALNEGLAAAAGHFIAVTDDDCRPGREWITQLERALCDRLSLCGGADRVPDDARRFLRYLDYVLTSFAGSAGLRTTGKRGEAYYPRRWNMAFDAGVVRQTGGFNGRLPDAWELDLANRLRSQGLAVGFVPKATVRHQRDTDLAGYLLRNVRLAWTRARLPVHRTIYGVPALAAAWVLLLALISHSVPAVRVPLAAGVGGYCAALFGSGVHAAATLRDPLALAAVPVLIFLQHFTHAVGYGAGLAANGGAYVRRVFGHVRSGSRV